MFKNKFYVDTFKALVLITSVLGMCRLTMGGAAVLVALMGMFFALTRKPGYMGFCYVLFPLFTITNRVIVGISPVFLMTARIGNIIMILTMLLTGEAFRDRARERLPLGWIFVYCFVACLSSLDGWMPLISYLKITQFVLFVIGLFCVTKAIQQSEKGLYQLRCGFMAIAIILLLGSLLARFVPSVGFSMSVSRAAAYGLTLTADEILAYEGVQLFNGMTCHSQMLAPTVSMMAAWVLCDMLLVERRIGALHLILLATAPVLLYLSRSRGGLLELIAVMGVAMLFCVPRARLSKVVKSKLSKILFLAAAALFSVALVSQVRNQSISKWLRKTEDVRGDNRSLKEAFTGSRQALIEYNLHDFELNPLLGKGFQVMAGMEQAYRTGLITWYSASVEKGVTPYVILGETGIVGAGIFIIFLISFYGTCLRRRYLSLLTSFTCVLVANLADSSLFSPSGMGGFMWIVSCVGAFSTDLISIRMAHREMAPGMVGTMPMPPPMPPPRMLGRPMRMG